MVRVFWDARPPFAPAYRFSWIGEEIFRFVLNLGFILNHSQSQGKEFFRKFQQESPSI